MTEKRFMVINGIIHNEDGEMFQSEICDELNRLSEENQLKDEYIKGYQLEVKRLHHLADAMSGVLREFGIFDVFDKEAIAEALKKFNLLEK